MAEKETENKISLTEAQIKDLKGAFEKGSFSDYSEQLKGTLQSLENICLDVGITGEPGVGKSTFINAFRDLRAEDEGAAPTRGASANKEPTAYPHPKYASVILWDLPSIGAPDFHPREYLQQINAPCYDFFIILASQRFGLIHAKLAQYLLKLRKDFYFVRSKVDEDMELGRQECPSSFSEADALQEIREGCLRDLQASGVKSPKIFLISNLSFSKYDFPLLGETLWKDLDLQKSHSFLLATPNISHRLLEKKKSAIMQHLWLVCVVACGVHAEPIPEISIACDTELLVKTLQGYCVNFGLEESSLRKVAEHAELPFEQLRALVKAPLAAEVAPELVVELLVEAAGKAPKLPKQLVPIAAMGLSFAVVYNMLKAFVEEVAADAHRILLKVFMSHKPREESQANIPGALEDNGGKEMGPP
ncbi:interferon-inducible GTPase 5-like [Sceloporus undulatus]|uniref:interferon-inducible GTPase 5-like n=1 Tax=Sceloporus undulatus TaxID=8520 RepID=UPI001C4B3283|nr:interferon-inducible GTPase 5-like [Sceloporus undulatus]XP_042295551.1 interferon-inducible GTPase 5-like [Sceloporus undulatus]